MGLKPKVVSSGCSSLMVPEDHLGFFSVGHRDADSNWYRSVILQEFALRTVDLKESIGSL